MERFINLSFLDASTRAVPHQFICFITILAFSATLGCSTWRPAPSTYIVGEEPVTLENKRVRFYIGDEVQTINVRKVDYPYAEGIEPQSSQLFYTSGSPKITPVIRIDLRTVDRIEVFHRQTGKTVLAVVGVVVAMSIIALALALATWEF